MARHKTVKYCIKGIVLCLLTACQGAPDNVVAHAKVVSVGKKHLVLQDAGAVLFVTIDDTDKERLKELKKGENVSLLGSKDTDAQDGSTAADIEAVLLENGTRIPLGQVY